MIIVVSALTITAQEVNLTGKVTNASGGSPLANVIVTLKNTPALIDTTKADGTYQLSRTVGIQYNLSSTGSFSGNLFNNGILEISVAKQEPVTVETFSLNGVLRARLVHEVMEPGLYKFDIRKSCASTNMFIITVRQGDKTTTYPVFSLNASFTNNISTDRQAARLAKCGALSATFSDTIICSLSGFTTAKTAIAAPTGVNDISLTAASGQPTVTDADGNVYHTVTIGTQVWMVENLKTTKYNDGTPIPLAPGSAAWEFIWTGAYCWYNNDITNKNPYGAIYNYFAISTNKLAPTGWHVPTDAEWSTLTTYLGGESVAGGKLKEAGTTHWASPNKGATNETGFSALPGGYLTDTGVFTSMGKYGDWLSATKSDNNNAVIRMLLFDAEMVITYPNATVYGFSVRCVKD
jgi:uncharacterized protein (TIGR02145 family)